MMHTILCLLMLFPNHCGCIGTQSLSTAANPLLYEPIWKAAGMVKCPDPGFNTVYDQWLHFSSKDYNGTTKPL